MFDPRLSDLYHPALVFRPAARWGARGFYRFPPSLWEARWLLCKCATAPPGIWGVSQGRGLQHSAALANAAAHKTLVEWTYPRSGGSHTAITVVLVAAVYCTTVFDIVLNKAASSETFSQLDS